MFLRNGMDGYFAHLKYEPTTADLQPYFNHLENIEKKLDGFIFAFNLGFFLGITTAILAVCINLFVILLDFKQKVLQARKGVFEFDRSAVSLKSNVTLAGAIVTNSILVFFICAICGTGLFSILA